MRVMPSCTAITVPTLAVDVVLSPKPAMFFSMMALISSAQDAIVVPPVYLFLCLFIMVSYLAEPVFFGAAPRRPRQHVHCFPHSQQGRGPGWRWRPPLTAAVARLPGDALRYHR